MTKDFSIFSGSKFIESMRSGGYRDTSYAVAEIVDNAIDADAKHIEIICQDKLNPVTNRYSLDKIAVLDDGHGMNSLELRSAFLFGDGTRGSDQKDIGKYGMGLPNASLSQCKRVEAYSWQNSKTPIYSYIDVDEIKKGKKEVPSPLAKDIPPIWKKTANDFSKKSGTIIIWNKLDRCSWTSSNKLIEHSQFLIGRIYRKFLAKKNITIHMTSVRVDDNDQIIEQKAEPMLPNDPLYLMAPSSTPGEWGEKAMFKPDTTPEEKYPIEHDGKKHHITVRYTIEKNELRDPKTITNDPGNSKHGKHAGKNMGVSLIRAGREISLDTSLLTTSEPRDRWWGVEIDVPPSLDLVVGLTNTKQRMDILISIMRTVRLFEEDESDKRDLTEELSEQDSARMQLFNMIIDVNSNIRSMARRIRARRARRSDKSNSNGLDVKIEHGIEEDIKKHGTGKSEKDREYMKTEQRIEVISRDLISDGMSENEARELARYWVESDKKVVFDTIELDGSSFFAVQNIGGILRIKINPEHRAYKNLLSLTNKDEYKEMDNSSRLNLTQDGLKLLLVAWARLENRTENKDRLKELQNVKFDWGRELDIYLSENEV